MTARVLDATVVDTIIVKQIVDKCLVWWFRTLLDIICDLASYVIKAIWTATATLGKF